MSSRPTPRQLLFVVGSILLAPLVTLYATQAVWFQDLAAPFPWMAAHLPAVGLFWVLFSSLSLTLYGFIRRLFFAYLPEVVLFMTAALASWYKYDINGAPLQLSDFSFLEGLGDIAGYAAAQLTPSLVTVVAVVLALLLLVILWRKETWRIGGTPGFILGSLCMVLFFSALNPGVLQSAAVKLDEGCQDQKARNDEVGVVLGLYSAWSQRLLIESGSADPNAAAMASFFREDANSPAPPAPADSPDIIFVTSESFFDITRLPGLTFENDPLPVFHELSDACTNGRFLSNTYGGGTGYVEMEMFTAMTSSLLKEGDTLSTLPSAAYGDLPTTVRMLKKAGYATTALHSHDDTLYNRSTIYPLIGFDSVLFAEDFVTPAEIKGSFISDKTFAQEIIARYEARDPSAPCFLYGLSMENHQGYTADKYPEPSGFPVQCDKLSDEDLAMVDSLVMGLHDADASLGMLTEYFSHVDRPVMLVFVGDHLPSMNLSDGVSLYTRLVYSPTEEASDWDEETMFNMLSTDYLIWTNYETQHVPDHTESCTFLGLHALKRAGLELNDYFSWLDEDVASQMLLSRHRFFAAADGTPSYEVPDTFQKTLETYTAVERNLLYG